MCRIGKGWGVLLGGASLEFAFWVCPHLWLCHPSGSCVLGRRWAPLGPQYPPDSQRELTPHGAPLIGRKEEREIPQPDVPTLVSRMGTGISGDSASAPRLLVPWPLLLPSSVTAPCPGLLSISGCAWTHPTRSSALHSPPSPMCWFLPPSWHSGARGGPGLKIRIWAPSLAVPLPACVSQAESLCSSCVTGAGLCPPPITTLWGLATLPTPSSVTKVLFIP